MGGRAVGIDHSCISGQLVGFPFGFLGRFHSYRGGLEAVIPQRFHVAAPFLLIPPGGLDWGPQGRLLGLLGGEVLYREGIGGGVPLGGGTLSW